MTCVVSVSQCIVYDVIVKILAVVCMRYAFCKFLIFVYVRCVFVDFLGVACMRYALSA